MSRALLLFMIPTTVVTFVTMIALSMIAIHQSCVERGPHRGLSVRDRRMVPCRENCVKHGAPFDKGDALPVLPLPIPHDVSRRARRLDGDDHDTIVSARKLPGVRTDDATSRHHAFETMIHLQPADKPQR